eukprot:TRINITY_DN16330_c0_g3_i1.p2 TRINITY_DN16330_c0_g3~~TRINITY_DN16330_c0_g3_i1.p2  ORF type:complete len:164 (+),score=50.60 TRINITY_DN16330_c0_g3_i1:130-621(+)
MAAAVQITDIANQSSRVGLKKAMEVFGEVVACHMGNRGVDKPLVRFKNQASAEAAVAALGGNQVWLDGFQLKGLLQVSSDKKDGEKGGGKGGGGRDRGAVREEAGMNMTSRDLMPRRGSGGGGGGHRRSRSRSRSRGKRRHRRDSRSPSRSDSSGSRRRRRRR